MVFLAESIIEVQQMVSMESVGFESSRMSPSVIEDSSSSAPYSSDHASIISVPWKPHGTSYIVKMWIACFSAPLTPVAIIHCCDSSLLRQR